MARLPIANRRRRRQINSILCTMVMVLITLFMNWLSVLTMYSKYKKRILPKEEKSVERMQYLFRLIRESDSACISQLRMDRRTFSILCELVRDVGGLRDTRNMTLQEIVAIFVYVLAHHKKNRTVSHKFLRSGETVSRHFNKCLLAILKLHHLLLKTPEPISDECTDDRWKYFKNCLGALDGTLIAVTPPAEHKSRYRSRKANLSTNVLGVCAPDMQFIYVLPGWEGSAHDGRVLRDAISRPNGLKVPKGCYYLVDAGYCNSEGFLAPYRGQRYHLNQIHGRRPESAEEYFNMKHSKARNVIERCFGLLKGRWKILASATFFPIETQGRIILACCLLQNLIRRTMSIDPQELREESGEDEDGVDEENEEDDEEDIEVEYISVVASSDEWTNFRNNLAQQRMDIVDESSGTQRGRGKNKCFWTNKEIDALIQSLQEMASDPLWKTDGGFKNGYMTELRKMIQGKIPDFTKQVDPHIDSKLKWLKNKYHAICEMLKESGCKCDTTEKVIRCEREWYDSWIKRHKEAKGLWNMKFPYLDDLEIVYGKDRAIGVAVEDFEDAINNLEAEESAKAAFVNVETDEELTSRKQKKQGFHVRKEARKLKTSIPLPVEAQFEMVTNKFVASIDMISSHFSSIATAMTNEDKREQLAFDRSNSVVAELLQLGFSDVESSRAGDILTATPTKITVFYQLSAHARRQYIMNLLYQSAGSFSSSSY